ncbi:CitMHS family transporter [Allonocardiopsis opalescens]|uniref:CitMHS family citrate-Mg2+:H+ or citrate-Ca2+:H+ symporter n=1 Tax=Allonocardiopsis opalescens TaxID=1144618 RepID=A0A2T0Q2Y5_9ACTN|nr:citrate:proton symporter [Allonocardiopsis opalescens]PRX98149.1 CitMHS family citrate-Mg2+:H+ or citrate-Ca2+:H+ symporter [Allonocardiopsis opalescens]
MVAALGLATIGLFLALVMTKRVSVLVALVLVPIPFALIGGFGPELGTFVLDGLTTVAPTGIMIAFAVLYFSLMIDVGLFDPIIRGVLKLAKGDPMRITVGTAVLTMVVALDGEGASTFLITLSAMLPIYQRLGMSRLLLTAVVCLGAGVMNMIPWGGPTARALATLDLTSAEVFTPVLPAMAAGIAWVLFSAFWLGRKERIRLAAAGAPLTVPAGTASGAADTSDAPAAPAGAPDDDGAPTDRPRPHPLMMAFNALLTVALIVSLVVEVLPLPVLFMIAFAVALVVNMPRWEDQHQLLNRHAKNVVLVTTMIFAAGVFTGILNGSGMIEAMAQGLVALIPDALGGFLPLLVALTSMPLSLVFTPDAYYFGVLPVLAESAAHFGHDPAEISRAAILGQMTTGFPLSPLTPATFILVGMAGVQLGEHQRKVFGWAFGTTLVMTAVSLLTGAITVTF